MLEFVKRPLLLLAFLAALMVAALPQASHAAECGLIDGTTTPCFCGDTVVGDYTLTENLATHEGAPTCTGDGLVLGIRTLGKDSPNLDCANFEIAGGGTTGNGITVADTRVIRQISNCKIHGFTNGVYHNGGGNGFTLTNSEIHHNTTGVVTIASGDIVISHNSIHDNTSAAVSLDETPRVEISDNHIYNNQYGLLPGWLTGWTTDLTALAPDNHKIYRNLIEGNSDTGLSVYGNYSEIKDNIIQNNKIGLQIMFARPDYRTWEGGEVVDHGFGAKRTSQDLFSGNQISNNTSQDLNISWDPSSIQDSFQNFTNTFTANSVAGKDVVYQSDISDQTFSGLDVAAFICMNCHNVHLTDSAIREIYFAYSSGNTIENITSDGAYNVITLTESSNNTFKNITAINTRQQAIAQDRASINNVFINAGVAMRRVIIRPASFVRPHGSVSPSGTVLVTQGSSATFSITPDDGYQLATLKFDGTLQATTTLPVESGHIVYALSDVEADHTILLTFTPGSLPVTVVESTTPVPNPSSGSGGGGGGDESKPPTKTQPILVLTPAKQAQRLVLMQALLALLQKLLLILLMRH